jgi:hypothetical protein
MTDTPETDHIENNLGDDAHPILLSFCRKLERERDSWKAAHDNQVKLKRIISERPDLKEHAKLVAELIKDCGEYWGYYHEEFCKEKLLDNADKHSKMYP